MGNRNRWYPASIKGRKGFKVSREISKQHQQNNKQPPAYDFRLIDGVMGDRGKLKRDWSNCEYDV